MHQSKNLQPLRLSTTLKPSQYWTATASWTAHFPSWHKGKLSSIALAFPPAKCSEYFLLNIRGNPCFYYFSSLTDSTLLSIKQPSSNSSVGVLTVLGLRLTATAIRARGHYLRASETGQDSAVTGEPYVLWFFAHRLSSRQLIRYFYQFTSNYPYLLASFSPLICILEGFMFEIDRNLTFGGGSSQFPRSVKHHRSKEEWQ